MRVLRPGRKQDGWAKKYECTGEKEGGCTAILLVEEGDLFKTYQTSMGRDTTIYLNFKCPNCGQINRIDQKGVPTRVFASTPDQKDWES